MLFDRVLHQVGLEGGFTGWFVARDAPNFSVIRGVAAMMIIAVVVALVAFWPTLFTEWGKRHQWTTGLDDLTARMGA